MKIKNNLFIKRKIRNRTSIKKRLGSKLRLSIFRSNKHIYCQIIDDMNQKTICSSSTLDLNVKKSIKSSGTKEAAIQVGKDIAKKAKQHGVEQIVFDRGGYLYHGRVKSLADGARENGLKNLKVIKMNQIEKKINKDDNELTDKLSVSTELQK